MGKTRRKTCHPLRLTDLWSRGPHLPLAMPPIVATSTEVDLSYGSLNSGSSNLDSNLRSNSELGERREAVITVSPMLISSSHPTNENGLVSPSPHGSPPFVSTFSYVLPRKRKYRNSALTNDQTRMQYKRRCAWPSGPHTILPSNAEIPQPHQPPCVPSHPDTDDLLASAGREAGTVFAASPGHNDESTTTGGLPTPSIMTLVRSPWRRSDASVHGPRSQPTRLLRRPHLPTSLPRSGSH